MEEDFGEPFSVGDIIGCYAVSGVLSEYLFFYCFQRWTESPFLSTLWFVCQSFSTDAVELSFCKNGRFMGAAFSVGPQVLSGHALFPHVLCKSCLVRFHLDPTAPPWYPGPDGFTQLAALPGRQRVCAALEPTSRAQCEVRHCGGISILIF